jgi:uncharacterized membrane protein
VQEQFQPGLNLGANQLPYSVPIHPQFVHVTLGLFIIAILFDIAGTLFPLEKPIFKIFGLTALRSGFFTVGWYNLFAAAVITFFTVAAGFFELFLATPPPGTSAWGLNSSTTMLVHGVLGVLILAAIVGMTLWRGLQRYRWRSSARREVQWSYLLVGIAMLGILFIHGTLGAQLGDEFGIHNTAANLVRQGQNPNVVLK